MDRLSRAGHADPQEGLWGRPVPSVFMNDRSFRAAVHTDPEVVREDLMCAECQSFISCRSRRPWSGWWGRSVIWRPTSCLWSDCTSTPNSSPRSGPLILSQFQAIPLVFCLSLRSLRWPSSGHFAFFALGPLYRAKKKLIFILRTLLHTRMYDKEQLKHNVVYDISWQLETTLLRSLVLGYCGRRN